MAKKSRTPWDDATYNTAPLPRYDSLFDSNLKTHYEKRSVRERLYYNNLIDKDGKILASNKTKLAMIEQEFAAALTDDSRKQKLEEYERSKLEAKKNWVRQHEKKVQRSHMLRHREQEKREMYKEKVSIFLLPQSNNSILNSTRKGGRRSQDDIDLRSSRIGSRSYVCHKKESPETHALNQSNMCISAGQSRGDNSNGRMTPSQSSSSSFKASSRREYDSHRSSSSQPAAPSRDHHSDSDSYDDGA